MPTPEGVTPPVEYPAVGCACAVVMLNVSNAESSSVRISANMSP